MKKSNHPSTNVLENFKNSWLDKINAKNSRISLVIRHDFNKFLKTSNPSESDFNDFESALQQNLLHPSLGLMGEYQIVIKTFYDTWFKFWSK